MVAKKAPKKKTAKKIPKKRKKSGEVDDPPIIVGGGGSTLIWLPKGTPKDFTDGDYDVYKIDWNVKTIVRKDSKNGKKLKDKTKDNGYEVAFWSTDF